jgi:hypothetical protein
MFLLNFTKIFAGDTAPKKILAFCFIHAPFYLLCVIALAFVIALFKLPPEESLQALNVSFPVVGILAGISFTWAQCLPEGNKKEKALLASKQFFHSLIMLLLAILTKYLSLEQIPGITVPRPVLMIIEILVYYSVCTALAFFYAGLFTTSRNLWRKDTEQ